MAAREMLPLTVALRDVFLVSVVAQEIVARAEAVQEVPVRAVPLQEVAGLMGRAGSARARHGWVVGEWCSRRSWRHGRCTSANR